MREDLAGVTDEEAHVSDASGADIVEFAERGGGEEVEGWEGGEGGGGGGSVYGGRAGAVGGAEVGFKCRD